MYFSIMEEKMDNQKLAELLFPDVTKTPEYYEEKYPYRKLPNKAEVTRLAPSPTGFIHLGNLYSALTDERLAHRNGGKFYLRIEDTDAKRTVEGAVDTVINVLRYFNIEFDEGAGYPDDDERNAYGPYYQTQRVDIYHVYAKSLVERGLAYPCFCTEEELEEVIQIALEMRRRVKEQLKKLGGMEFYDVNFSYIDLEDMSEHYVSVPEQGGGKLIPDGMCNPGQVYTVSRGKSGMIGVFRLESQMLPGNGKMERTGLGSDSKCKEAVNTAFNYLKANGSRISGSISTSTKDYIINYQDLQGIGMTDKLALPSLIALCSIALGKPVVSNLAVLGDITISGTMIKVDELANTLQVCLDSGAKKVLIPSTSFVDFASVPADLMSAFQLIPYQSAEDAVFKALGVE